MLHPYNFFLKISTDLHLTFADKIINLSRIISLYLLPARLLLVHWTLINCQPNYYFCSEYIYFAMLSISLSNRICIFSLAKVIINLIFKEIAGQKCINHATLHVSALKVFHPRIVIIM